MLLTLALFLAGYTVYVGATDDSAIPGWLSLVGSIVLLPIAGFVVKRVLGDAARYLHVAPHNIQCRNEIRQAGVELLNELHNPDRNYSRILIVGHSLGSVIGYDILTHSWANFHKQRARDEKPWKEKKSMDPLGPWKNSRRRMSHVRGSRSSGACMARIHKMRRAICRNP